MNRPECAQAPMVEALRDGRLGAQERASIERHLAACAVCTGLTAELDRIAAGLGAPLPHATPIEHQRARIGLLRSAAQLAPARTRASSPRFFAFAAAFACLLAAGIGFAGARLSAPVAVVSVAQRALASRAAVALASLRGVKEKLARTTTLRPSSDARFERTLEGSSEVISLTDGALDLTVRPLGPGERFLVRAPDGEVEVRGTVFRVEVGGGKIRRVAVSEGQVEVRIAGASALIPAGGSWVAGGGDPHALDAPVVAAPRPSPARPIARRPKAVEAPSAKEAAEPVAPAAPEEAAAPRGPSEREIASEELAAAMRAMGTGDYGAAADKLGVFSARHGTDARADEADYLQAVALERAGRTAAAAEAARRYLAGRSGGAHRVEAKRIADRYAPAR